MANSRFAALTSALQVSGLDALALNAGYSLTYLSGLHFHLSERPVMMLFVPGQPPVFVLPELEMPKLTGLSYNVKVFPYGENPFEWDGLFRQAALSLGLDGKRIGVEPRAMRLLEFRYLQAGAPKADFPDASGVVGGLRMVKDDEEIVAMRKAVDVAQSALEAMLPGIKVGMSENELAAELVVQLLRQGSQSE
jgi:Xaa-Pro dipeptidase